MARVRPAGWSAGWSAGWVALAWIFLLLFAAPTAQAQTDPSSPPDPSSPQRPEVEVLTPGEDPIRAEGLGRRGEQHWVGIAGQAFPVESSQTRRASMPLNELLAHCVTVKAPEHQDCYARISKRLAKLSRVLRESQDDANSPLNIPPGPKVQARKARLKFFRRLDALIKRTRAIARREQGPTSRDLRIVTRNLRWFAAQLTIFSTLQRGRFGLAVRGGTSMGSYQAGLLYYLSEFLKAHQKQWNRKDRRLTGAFQDKLRGQFDFATGSSAGAFNALLVADHGCKQAQTQPEQSHFYQSWINVGITGRHGAPGLRKSKRRRRAKSDSFFSDAPIQAAGQGLLEDFTQGQGYRRGCELDLGLTLTRLDDNDFPLLYQDNEEALLSARRARERFAFHLKFHGKKENRDSGALTVTNRRPQGSLHRQGLASLIGKDELAPFYLAMGKPGEHARPLDPELLLNSAMASGAVPFAFPPRSLHFTAFTPDGQVSLEQSGEAKFVDGGIFDNRPLDLAMKLGQWRRADKIRAFAQRSFSSVENPRPELKAWQNEIELGMSQAITLRDWQLWRAKADLQQKLEQRPPPSALPHQPWQEILDLIPFDPTTLIFVEPTLTTWSNKRSSAQAGRPQKPRPKKPRLVPLLTDHLGNFVQSARQANLFTTVEQHPWIQRDSAGDLRTRVVIPQRSMPITGEQLYRFMAFFERDFRIFDFFVGISDARRFVHHDDPVFRLSGATPQIDDPRFVCLEQYKASKLEHHEGVITLEDLLSHAPTCKTEALLGPELTANLAKLNSPRKLKRLQRRAIAKIGLPRSKKSSSDSRRTQLGWAEQSIAAHNFSAMLVAMHNFGVWQSAQEKTPTQSDVFDAFFDAVTNANFRYVDLQNLSRSMGMGLARIMTIKRGLHGRGASKIVRQVLEEAVHHLARVPKRRIDRVGVRLLGKAAADLFRPYDPTWSLDLGLINSGIELRLLSHPFYNRFRIDWAVLRFHRIGDYTLLHRSRTDLPKYNLYLTDLDFSFRLGARLFSMTKLLRASATLGPVFSVTYNADSSDTPFDNNLRFMRRIGSQLALELTFLRRIYVEFGLTYWIAEYGDKSWHLPGETQFNWFTDTHSSSAGRCHPVKNRGKIVDCLQTTLSAGWRWDL